MKIREIFVRRFGPLSGVRFKLRDGFTLLFGRNESGKTLLLDAILRFVFGASASRDIPGITRVSAPPEGFVVFESGGRSFKVSSPKWARSLSGLNLSKELLRLFFVRDGDLSMEEETWVAISEKLVGVKLGDVERLKDAVRDVGRITRGGSLRDIKGEKLLTKYKRSKTILKKIETLLSMMEEEGFDRMEVSLFLLESRLSSLKRRIALLECARELERKRKLEGFLRELREVCDELGSYEELDGELLKKWELVESELSRLEVEVSRLQKRVEELEGKVVDLGRKLEARREELSHLREKPLMDMRMRLKEVSRIKDELDEEEGRLRFFRILSVVSLGMGFVSLVAFIRFHMGYLVALAFLALLLTAFSLFREFKRWRLKRRFLDMVGDLRLSLGFSASSFDEIGKTLEELELRGEALEREIRDMEAERRHMLSLLEEKKGEFQRVIGDMERLKRNVLAFRMTSGCGSPEELSRRLKEKMDLVSRRERLEGALGSALGFPAGDEDTLSFWEKAISSIKVEDCGSVEFSEEEYKNALREKEACEEELNGIRRRMEAFRDEILGVMREVSELFPDISVGGFPGYRALSRVHGHILGWCSGVDRKRELALFILDVLGEIEREEKNKIDRFLSSGDRVSHYFREVTGGRYEGVLMRSHSGEVVVIDRDGVELDLSSLSGGTRDQLLFSFRLALSEELLGDGEKGFFVMDDPMVRYDEERLERQMNMILDASHNGWQIIYLTCKREVLELLSRKEGVTILSMEGL